MATVGTPSIFSGERLFGPVSPGALATIYGGTRTKVTDITATNTLAVATGLTLYLGISGYTGNASYAYAYNQTIPADGMPVSLIQKDFILNTLDNIQALSSLASGVNLFGQGLKLE